MSKRIDFPIQECIFHLPIEVVAKIKKSGILRGFLQGNEIYKKLNT
jgi:hypothetical protein